MGTQANNYTGRIAGFTTVDFYQAAAVPAFNVLTAGGLAAFVLFIVRGDYQQLGAVNPVSQFLWGNLSGFTGWSLSIEPGTVDPQLPMLRASLGDGAAVDVAENELFMGQEGPTVIERLCLAGIFWDGANLVLTLNGSILAVTAGAAAYAPSAAAARLGNDPAGAVGANFVDFVSCGYGLPGFPLAADDRLIGALAGSHFRSARASLRGDFYLNDLINPTGIATDWAHRYEVGSLGAGLQGTLAKSVVGANLTTLPQPPAVWPDVGSSAPGMTPAPVALNRNGVGLVLSSLKNPDWATPVSYAFAGPPI